MINNENGVDLRSNKIKANLVEELGEGLKFCFLERKNQSQFVFLSAVTLEDVINSLCKPNALRTTEAKIQEAFLPTDFEIDNKFCHAEEFHNYWRDMDLTDILAKWFCFFVQFKQDKDPGKWNRDQGFDCTSESEEVEYDKHEGIHDCKPMMKISS